MSSISPPEERSFLLNAMADDILNAEQELRLIELLQTDADFRLEYVRFCQLLTQLRWQYESEPDERLAPDRRVSPVRSVSPTKRRRLTAFTVVMLLMVVVSWLNWNGSTEDPAGKLVSVSGRVEMIRNQQHPLWISPDQLNSHPRTLQQGDRLLTSRGSSATLQLADQTTIRIQPETEITVYPQSKDGISVPSGSIKAKVTPQSPRNPLTFMLPHAEVQVLGTELELLTLPGQSEVAVLEGKVQVTRNSDGARQLVSTGQFLPVTDSEPFSIVNWPRPADEWSIDFEHGLPAGWEGQRVRHALPKHSRGAIRSIPVQQDMQTVQKIQSPQVPSGLFFWHEDSQLQLRFKIQPPGWFHIYLHARTYQNPRPVLTYCYVDLRLWQTQPGAWRTVSIPLSEFRLQTYMKDNPELGCIPLQITFRGESETDGFMIDRIWVTRGNSTPPQIQNDVPTVNDMR